MPNPDDEIDLLILNAAAAKVAEDLARDGLDHAAMGDRDLGARLALALSDEPEIVLRAVMAVDGVELSPAAKAIADRVIAKSARHLAGAAA